MHGGEPLAQNRVGRIEEVGFEEFSADVALDGAQADASHRLHEGLLGSLREASEGGIRVGSELLLGSQLNGQGVDSGSAESERSGIVVRGLDLAALDDARDAQSQSSEERRVRKECVSTCRFWWWQYP